MRVRFQRGLGHAIDEPFPGRERSFDYTLVPTAWAQAGEAAHYLLALVAALGKSPAGGPMVVMKYELRAALVLASGSRPV